MMIAAPNIIYEVRFLTRGFYFKFIRKGFFGFALMGYYSRGILPMILRAAV